MELFGGTTITYDEVKAFVNQMKKKDYSASCIRDYVGQLSGIFQLAIRKGLRDDNPVRREDKKERKAIWPSDHISPRAKKYAKSNEVDQLVQAAMMIEVDEKLVRYDPKNGHPRRSDTRWLAPIIEFAFESGMRRSEIFNLTWDHVYLEPTEVHPHGYISLDKKDTKSGEGRQVPLSPAAAKVLKKQAKVRGRENPVFVGRTGRANPDIRKGWEEVKRKAALDGLGFGHERLKGLHFHDLRASWAVDSLGRGAHFLQVKTVGGWGTVTAMQRYLRCVEDDMSSLHKAYRNRNKRQKAS